MTKRKYKILMVFSIVALFLTGLIFYAVSVNHPMFWYCSPTEPRGNDIETWQETITPRQSTIQLDENFFENFTINSDANEFRVVYQTQAQPENPFAFDVMELTLGEFLEIGGGTLRLSAVGTAYHDANQILEDDAVYSFYDWQFQPIATPNTYQFGGNKEPGLKFSFDPYPVVKFLFESQGIEDLKYQGIKVFDSQTYESLDRGYGGGGFENYYVFDTHIPLWHRTPIDIIVDVSYGPVKTFEFAPRAGEGFIEGNFECRLINIFEGIESNRRISSSSNKTMTYRFTKTPSDDGGSCFLFACQPTANKMPVTFEFLDKNGSQINTRGTSTRNCICDIRLREPLENIALIRARYRTERKRIIIHLPYLPGLPKQNETIDNLFDVYVPYVSILNSREMESFLLRTLRLSLTRKTGLVPQSILVRGTAAAPPSSINDFTFPLEFRDVTIRDIAKTYAEGGSLSIDIENDQLNLEYPIPLLTRLKQYIQKMFR